MKVAKTRLRDRLAPRRLKAKVRPRRALLSGEDRRGSSRECIHDGLQRCSYPNRDPAACFRLLEPDELAVIGSPGHGSQITDPLSCPQSHQEGKLQVIGCD